jgi:hypothetical protein
MMKKIIVAACLSLSAIAQANDEWIKVANNDELTYEIKRGSVESNQTDRGTRVYSAIGRIVSNDAKKINGAIWYVSIEHCRLQRGKFVVLDTAGTYKSDHDFVFGLGTIAATIAETICLAAAPKRNSSPLI